MSYSTHVYAMLGSHCKDRVTVKTESVRGCSHPETIDKFCAICGKATWVDEKTKTYLSDQLQHLQEWDGNNNESTLETEGEFIYSKLAMIYSPTTGPTDFMVGRVLGSIDADDEGTSKGFQTLSDEKYEAIKAETKALLEPLGLWNEKKFGYRLYPIYI